MLVTMSTEPDRYDPLPSLLELPSFLIRKLSRSAAGWLSPGARCWSSP
jgi:hypothetical protein